MPLSPHNRETGDMKYAKGDVTYEADTAEELVALVRAFESKSDNESYRVVDPRRVYVVRWVDAEPYEPWSGVHKIFATREGAEAYIEEKGSGPHDQDLEDGAFGYYLSGDIQEYEVIQ